MSRKRKSLARDPDHAARAAEMLKAVAHPIRLRIVAILCEGSQQVSALAELIDTRQSLVSQQLRILRLNRLVEATRSAGCAHYHLAEPRLRDLVACVEGCRSSAA